VPATALSTKVVHRFQSKDLPEVDVAGGQGGAGLQDDDGDEQIGGRNDDPLAVI
jgi:hypothetical protein